MINTPLDDRYKFKVNVRPVRVAYFAWDDDKESLCQIMRIASTQWGGIRNLIIPVKSDLSIAPIFEFFIRAHEPDWFVSFLAETDESENEALKKCLKSLFPHRSIELRIREIFEEHNDSAHILDVIREEDFTRFEPRFKGVFSQPHGNILLTHKLYSKIDDSLTSADDILLLALFGAISPEQKGYYGEHLHTQQVEATVNSKRFWECQLNKYPFKSVLNLTAYGLVPRHEEGGEYNLESQRFDIVLASSLSSICLYWNLRSLRESSQFIHEAGRRTILLPEEAIDDRAALESLFALINEQPDHSFPSASSNFFFSSTLDLRFQGLDKTSLEHLYSVLQTLPMLETMSGSEVLSWTAGNREPKKEKPENYKLKYAIGIKPAVMSFREGIDWEVPLTVSLNTGQNEIYFIPPAGFSNRGGSLAIDFECEVWNRFPKDFAVADAFKQLSRFSRYGISYVGHIGNRPGYIKFILPDEWKTLEIYFKNRGYEINPSDKALYADAVVNLVGGLNEIGALASKGAYNLLDILTLRSTKKIAQRIVNQLGLDGSKADEIRPLLLHLETTPELKGIPKSYAQLKSDQRVKPFAKKLLTLLDELSQKQVIKRGFYLDCPHCSTPDWYPLMRINESVVCFGCSKDFPMPVEHPREKEIQWQYRLNTLVNRAMDQDVMPHLLALYYLSRNRKCSCMAAGIELKKGGEGTKEFDFLFVSDQKLLAGECKAGSELEEKDIRSMLLAAELGVSNFYFCTMSSTFSDDANQLIDNGIKELKALNLSMEVGILTQTELLGQAK